MGVSSLPKVGVPSLPVVLLFGKMNGVRERERRTEREHSWNLYRRSGYRGQGDGGAKDALKRL